MELHAALKELVEKWGDDIITDEARLKRLLANKKAYSERPETKEIVKFALEIGYFDRLFEACQMGNWESEFPEIEAEFNDISSPMGFDVDVVNYVFSCIPFSLGLIDIEENDSYEDDEYLDNEDYKEDAYTITKQYHENKEIDIFVVRLVNRVDTDTFSEYKNIAKSHGKGYYSTYRGVNGFVFYSMEDAKGFVEDIFGEGYNDDNDDIMASTIQSQVAKEHDADVQTNNSYHIKEQLYDSNNMDLHLALRNVIDTDGIDIVNDVRLVNILSDFKAFDAIPASKYILRAVIVDGYASRLVACGKWDATAKTLCSRFASSTGFQEDYVNLIFQSIAYGLRFLNKIEVIPNAPSQATRNANYSNGGNVNLNLSLSQSELNRKSEKFIQDYKKNVENYLDSIIEIKGDVKKEIGADISVSSEYDTGDNSFCINIEISGQIRYKFDNKYSSGLSFNIVLYNINNKVICKASAYVDKDSFKKSYQVLTSEWVMSRKFRHIADIKKLVIYWEE